MRLIDADKLPEHKFTRESAKGNDYMRGWNDAIDAIVDNEPTVCNDNYSMGYQDGVKKVLSERPQGEWIITGEEQGALGITYKIRKCDKCGWEHSLVIPDNFCPRCGADMRGVAENEHY